MLIELFISLTFLYLLYVYFVRIPDGFPPGEWGWPLIGHLPSSKIPMQDYIKKFRNKYGKTFTWRIGNRPVVFLCDYKTIKSAFGGSSVAERPPALSLDLYSEFKKQGISNGNGLAWQNLRRFSVRHLRDLGMGKSSLEDAITIEVESVLEDFKGYLNKPTTVPYSLNVGALNVIWKIAADVRYDITDPKIQKLQRVLTNIFCDAQRSDVMFFDFFHHLNRWTPNWFKKMIGLRDAYANAKTLSDFLQIPIDEHKKAGDYENPKDFIDHFLLEMQKQRTGKGSEATKTFTEKELLFTLLDLFAAGSETVSSTIRWVLIIMAEYPEIQKKVQQEIDAVVSRDQNPSFQDRDRMPYTDAVINEVMRFKTIVPFSLYHFTSQETVIDSYTIPKGTFVVSCAEYSHFDTDYWQNPEEFRPERFIQADGTVDDRKDGFLAFSVGKRICPGEGLSRMEVFLFSTALLHRFNFKQADKSKDVLKKVTSQPMFALPTETQIIIEERN